MTEENKDTMQNEPEEQEKEAPSTSKAAEEGNNHLAEKRGRMIAASVVAAVLLSVIAVVVYGIFHFTTPWFAACPSDVPVNDPAPKLWNKVKAEDLKSQPLGVPAKIEGKVYLRALGGPPK